MKSDPPNRPLVCDRMRRNAAVSEIAEAPISHRALYID
jgi:hypothetical protein